MKICCFTGHRMLPKDKIPVMKDTLKKEVINLINQGIEYFETGGAIGFDTLAAQTIIDLRKEYEQIKLILIIPCRDQACGWSYEDQIVYLDIKRKADKIIYLSEKYKRGCMFKRNRYMVEQIDPNTNIKFLCNGLIITVFL